MPIYEYVCADCNRGFEKYVRSWNEAVACPGCSGEQVEKQLSAFACGTAGPDPCAAMEASCTSGGDGSCQARGARGCH